jgi:hypothetical protein
MFKQFKTNSVLVSPMILHSESARWLDKLQTTMRDLLVAKKSNTNVLKSTYPEKEMVNSVVNKSYYWSHNNHSTSGGGGR